MKLALLLTLAALTLASENSFSQYRGCGAEGDTVQMTSFEGTAEGSPDFNACVGTTAALLPVFQGLPADASVSIQAFDPSLGGYATIATLTAQNPVYVFTTEQQRLRFLRAQPTSGGYAAWGVGILPYVDASGGEGW